MLTLNNVYDFIMENFEKVTVTKNGSHFHTRCPLCGDSKESKNKKRFHLQYEYDNCKYHCFNCEKKGDFYKIYGKLKGIETKEAWKLFHTYNSKQIKNKWELKKNISEKITEDKTFNWIKKECLSIKDTPKGYIQLKYYKILQDFIIKRKIVLDIFICYKGRYKDRIIMPVYDKKNIIFFQGRTINDSYPKYLNPSTDKQHIIFNKDNFIKNKPIFITEGLIDAQNIETNGTCCLGKSISDDFLYMIYKYTETIIIVLDNDIDGQKSLKKVFETSKYKQQLLFFLMPVEFYNIKDINQLITEHKNINNISEFILKNSYPLWNITTKLNWRSNAINRNRKRYNNS